MKTLRKLLAAAVLTCALTFSAMAGDMGTGIAQTPPQRVTGDMGTGVASTVDPVTEIVLSLLQGVLALF